jgi:hypothetical protein
MKKHEKLLYQENALSQQLILLFILGNTVFTIYYVNHATAGYPLGLFVLLNIFLSLFSFLIAVRQKIYDLQWGYTGILLAIFQFVRLLWIPAEITAPLRFYLIALLFITAMLALAGSVICVRRSCERRRFILENNIDPATLLK